MRELYHQSLQALQEGLVELSELVTVAIENATASFTTGDVSLADQVIGGDAVIDQKTKALDESAIAILAREQPVARDLRVVVATLRISASLERMGDLADHIAQLARSRFPERAVPKGLKQTFIRMGELDVQMARKLTQLLRTENLSLADEIRDDDQAIDELHVSVFEKVLGANWKGEAAGAIDATLASRYHERFADHAGSVARKVVYLATGQWSEDAAQDSEPPY